MPSDQISPGREAQHDQQESFIYEKLKEQMVE
uniref:Uncharacterized protein n=1 Tax=Arundo donax TaxID=35708 RepID=A0A0A8YNC6_ARUDO